MSKISKEDQQALHNALLDAFREINDLEDLYNAIFQEDFDQHFGAKPGRKEAVDYIINRCAASDLLKKLIDSACEINKTNKALEQLKYTAAYHLIPTEEVSTGAKIYPKPASEFAMDKADTSENRSDYQNPEDRFIKFVNREKELDRIFMRSPQSSRNWIIDGPPGYGKTELLNELDRRYKKENWITFRVTLPRNSETNLDSNDFIVNKVVLPIYNELHESTIGLIGDPSKQIDEIGMEIASIILEKFDEKQKGNPVQEGGKAQTERLYTDRTGVAILIDNIEALPDTCVSSFLSLLEGVFVGLLNVGSYFPDHQLRIFVAGRYARNKIKRVSTSFAFAEIPLEPFTFEVVSDTVRDYAMREGKSDVPNLSNIAAHMMYLTGGHPGFMADLLEELIRDRFVKGPLPLMRRSEEYQTTFTKKFYTSLLSESPRLGHQKLVEILTKLSPYRKYDRWFFLKELRKHDLLPAIIDEEDLEKELLNTYLVDRQSGFLHDGIFRFLLEIWLRLNDPEDYKARMEAGIAIYEAQLDLPNNFRQVEILAVELLYIKMMHNYHVKELRSEALIEATDQDLKRIIKKITQKAQGLQEQDIQTTKEAFIECLRRDIEFRFLYNFSTKGENFDEQFYEAFINSAEKEIYRM